jgi:vacuolar-type H+-ATPase subunit I/STV1
LLDAIEMALGGGRSIPGKPIRDGEDSARIVLETDELIITRTFTQKGSYLKVANKDGAKFSNGQEVLDALIGKYSFDPLDFTRLDPKKQAETLRELVGIDTSSLDLNRQVAYSARTDINRDVKRFEAALQRSTYHEGVGDAEKNAAEIVEAIEFANENNAKFRNAEQAISVATTQISAIEDEISRLQGKLREAMDQKSKALKVKS